MLKRYSPRERFEQLLAEPEPRIPCAGSRDAFQKA